MLFSYQTFQTANINYCNCSINFLWDSVINKCVRNCTNATNSLKTYQTNNIAYCNCIVSYQWNTNFSQCLFVRNCTNDNNSLLYAAPWNTSECLCKNGYVWSPQNNVCTLSCPDDLAANGILSCQLNGGYINTNSFVPS